MVVSRSAHCLGTADAGWHPSCQLKIDLRVANSPAPGKPKVGTRGIAVVAADTQPALPHQETRKAAHCRKYIAASGQVNADTYISIIDVDSGRESAVFQMITPSLASIQRDSSGGETVLFLDSP